jgi:hypothetical protein
MRSIVIAGNSSQSARPAAAMVRPGARRSRRTGCASGSSAASASGFHSLLLVASYFHSLPLFAAYLALHFHQSTFAQENK